MLHKFQELKSPVKLATQQSQLQQFVTLCDGLAYRKCDLLQSVWSLWKVDRF